MTHSQNHQSISRSSLTPILCVLLAICTLSAAQAQIIVTGTGAPIRLRGRYALRYYTNPYGYLPYATTNYGYGYYDYSDYYRYYYDPAMRLKQEWWSRENDAARKLEFERSTDERKARAELDRIQALKNRLTRFVNGSGQALDAAAFRAALTEIESSHAQTQFMQQPIQPVAPEMIGEFASMGLVRGDGELKMPPHALYNRTDTDPSHNAWVKLNTSWRDARWNLFQNRMAAPQDINGIETALVRWDQTSRIRLSSAGQRDRKAASRYLAEAKRLVRTLQSQVDSMKLARHLNVARRGFQGGTVGDYIRFVADNRVKLRYGTDTHQVINDLVYDTQRALEVEIEQLVAAIDRLKAQNPAHNSALREQAMMANQSGLYAGTQDGPRPSHLNHPPQDQVAGLGSRAYATDRDDPPETSQGRYTLPTSLQVSHGPAGRMDEEFQQVSFRRPRAY